MKNASFSSACRPAKEATIMGQKKEAKASEVKSAPVAYTEPFAAFQRGIDRLLGEFRHGSLLSGLPSMFDEGRGVDVRLARLDVAETDDEVQVTADLPGMDEKDVEVTIGQRSLTIRGEKKSESEEKKKNYYVKERSYGSFQRTIALPEGVSADKAKATFKKGVLTIAIPKTPKAKAAMRKVQVQAS
jgi:HSP20 family protein